MKHSRIELLTMDSERKPLNSEDAYQASSKIIPVEAQRLLYASKRVMPCLQLPMVLCKLPYCLPQVLQLLCGVLNLFLGR